MLSNDVKLLAVYDKLEKQIKALQLKHGVDGADGADGISIKGEQGDRGHDGVGHDGKQGAKGSDGSDGADGSNGVSITDATVDFDNHLVLKLSDGTEIDAGEITGGSGGDQYLRVGGGSGQRGEDGATGATGTAGGDGGYVGSDAEGIRTFHTRITIPVGNTVVAHNMNLTDQDAFMANFMADGAVIVYGFSSVNVNSFSINSALIERTNVSIFLTGLGA